MSKQLSYEKKESRPLKIGFVFDDSLDRSDGVAHQVKTLGKWLSEQGHEVRYLVGQTNLKQWQNGRIYSLSRNISVSFNGNRLTTPLPANKNRIQEVLATENFDVLHIQVPYSPFMGGVVVNNAAARVGVVGTFHILPAGRLASWGTWLLRPVYGKSLKRIDEMLSVSRSAAKFADFSLKLESKVLPNAVELAALKNNTKLSRSSKRIVFLGRLVDRKGCRQLLEAFSILASANPEINLIIASDGPERGKLENFVRRKSLDSQVTFLGFISEEEKSDLLGSADIACFPSMYGESFGIVLVEAMAAGAGVVIGGNNPGYATVLDKEALFDPKDAVGLASMLENLLNDKDLVSRIHLKQQEDVKQYNIELVGPRLLEVYRSVVAKKQSKSHNKV